MTTTAFVTGGSGFIGGRLIDPLHSEGWSVPALARSDRPPAGGGAGRARVEGREKGDGPDPDAIREGAHGCEYAFHAAAHVGDWGPKSDFVRANVAGTHNVLAGTAAAGVKRFVHVGTEAALLAGQPRVNADES